MEHSFPDPEADDTIIYNPSFEELREFSRPLETTTEFGSPAYVSELRSRSADATANSIEDDFTDEDRDAMKAAQARVREAEMVCIDRQLGRHPEYSVCCRYFVPKPYARLALTWAKLLEPARGDPDLVTVQLPDRDDVRIRALPEEGVTYVLGSDYSGEAKMSFLRLWLYRVKKQGALGLHAGSKRVRIRRGDAMKTVGQLYLGLSATGKSTLTGHGFGLDGPEEGEMVQDDICALLPDGSAPGTEGGGLYVKTYGLTAEEQPELYRAVTQQDAVLENVWVEDDGTVDFFNDDLTRNGRATILRENLESASGDIDLARVDQIFFITRNPLMPPIARLTPEQGAAAFMLGESVQTSAGDPSRAGEQIHVVGTNPFIIGPPGREGNRFLDLVTANDITCYLINTGHVGEDTPVEVEDTVAVLRAVARGTVEWRQDEILGLELPEDVPGMDIEAFYPPDMFDDYDERLRAVRDDREQWLSQFPELRDDIRDAVY